MGKKLITIRAEFDGDQFSSITDFLGLLDTLGIGVLFSVKGRTDHGSAILDLTPTDQKDIGNICKRLDCQVGVRTYSTVS